MHYENSSFKDLKIAYIGGGSRGWAWGLMSDLASAPDISGKVALYETFPGIKAFGCCHEVFGTQKLLASILREKKGIGNIAHPDIKVNVVGVNHFTWLTSAQYKNMDLFPLYREVAQECSETGFCRGKDENWMNNSFACCHKAKFDLFNRFGVIAAAGDRHLAEFCPGKWYLESPQQVFDWGFGLTPVQWRWKNLDERLETSRQYLSGEKKVELRNTGEDGVNQIRALLGLEDMVTNVNLPNRGQIPNLPLGAVVETNAVFRDDSVTPVLAGPIPKSILPLISTICAEQEMVAKACIDRDLELAFQAFTCDPLVTIHTADARKLFDEMVANTADYLKEYLEA